MAPIAPSRRLAQLIILALGAVSVTAGPAAAQIPFEVIARPHVAYRPPGSLEVVRSATELRVLWSAMAMRGDPPDVDFNSRMVVAYFMGSRPDGGSGLDVGGVRIRGGTMQVEVHQRESCGGTQFPVALAVVISTIRWPGAIEADRRLSGCIP